MKSSSRQSHRPPTAGFHRARRDHRSEVAEDYVELIYELHNEKGQGARAVDIAQRLGVSHVTVFKTVTRLMEAGLVTSEPYRSIFLTEAGLAMARQSQARHTVVLDFLLALGVDPEVAALDAEGIEHHVSQQTLEAMADYVKRRPV